MKHVLAACMLSLALCSAATHAFAFSAVFDGDPVDPGTSAPYEILPGLPLVLPGPDGLLGTADDVVVAATIGDIDMVVRAGSPAATAVIPAPAAQSGRATLPIGVAGSAVSGGSEIPFTVFLSDGITSPAAPYGHLLAAADMNGIPVVVAAFADFDGDGFIGPTDQDVSGAGDNQLEVRELEPIGRGAALFADGVARGSLAISAGQPASAGGLTVALTAMALTGPFDPNFFSGNVPSGPGITTALPFLPQRDLSRLVRDRAVPAGPTTTLQQVIQFAAVPPVGAIAPFALPLDGSSPTIDAAVVHSQSPVRAALREDLVLPGVRNAIADMVLGTGRPANKQRLRLVPVDRWDNPSDPPAGFKVKVRASAPLQIIRPLPSAASKKVTLGSASGVRLTLKVPGGTPDGTTGTITVERGGVVLATLPYRVDARVDRAPADLVVSGPPAQTIQSAIAAVSDVNGDGKLVISLGPGVYPENVTVDRSVELRGGAEDTTFIQGDGSTSAVTVTAPNVTIRDLTVVGGTSGLALGGGSAAVIDTRAWRNSSTGITVSVGPAQIWRSEASQNGGDGLWVDGATAAVCSNSGLIDNAGAGADLFSAPDAQLQANHIALNGSAGMILSSMVAPIVADNECVLNVGAGMLLQNVQYATITQNLGAGNDDDGMHCETTSGNLVSGNTFDSNKGYGLFLRQSLNDDFAAADGPQAPLGDNTAADNRKGDLLIRDH